jgi:hypothetical protein
LQKEINLGTFEVRLWRLKPFTVPNAMIIKRTITDILTKKMIRKLTISRLIRTPFVRNMCSFSNGLSDKELQLSFQGMKPRIMSLLQLFQPGGKEKYLELLQKGILSDPFNGLVLFTEFQNPLLIKYGFDPADFLIGAAEAFIQVNKAIASKDLANFASGVIQESESAKLLEESVEPRIYDVCLSTAKMFNSQDREVILTDITLRRVAMERITTRIIGSGDEKDVFGTASDLIDRFTEMKQSGESTSPSPSSAKSTRTLNYPVDSVVATVDVFFESEEQYRTRSKGGDGGADSIFTSSRINRSHFLFEGCISGQVELDWKIVSF